MKHGSEYAKRVKRLYHQLVRKFGKSPATELTDPTEQLIIGILSACTSSSKARAALRKILQQMVDLNELRVTPPSELEELIGKDIPLAKEKARRIINAMNAIRLRQDCLDLMFLRQRSRREAREYLESLEGVDRFAAASVVLHSLGGHAIPVDDLTVYVLRKEGIVEASADAATVQGFLERHISAPEARAFSELLSRYVAGKGLRVEVEKLDEWLNPSGPAKPEEVDEEASAASPSATKLVESGTLETSSSTTRKRIEPAGLKKSATAKSRASKSKQSLTGKKKKSANQPARRIRNPTNKW